MCESEAAVRARALPVVQTLIACCEKFQPKFAPGTAQHTLLVNRISALRLAQSLLSGTAGVHARRELERALPPIRSIAAKCEKACANVPPGTARRTRFETLIGAMDTASACIEREIEILGENTL